MADTAFEEALKAVRSLPLEEQRRLLHVIAQDQQKAAGQVPAASPWWPQKSYESEYQWLKEHRAEYAGQWVALDGDRLVSHGEDGRKVYAEARDAGVETPYLVHIEPADMLPFGGW